MVNVINRRESGAGTVRQVFHAFEHRGMIAFVATEVLLFAVAWSFIALFDGELANVFFGMAFSLGVLGAVLGALVGGLVALSRS